MLESVKKLLAASVAAEMQTPMTMASKAWSVMYRKIAR